MLKKTVCFLLICVFFVTVPAFSYDAGSTLKNTALYITENVPSPQNAMVGGEWSVIGMARGGFDLASSFFESYSNNLLKKLKETDGILHERKYTEYSRVILALTATGKNPENFYGFNLITKLEDYDRVVIQGLNGAAYALLALDSKNYFVSENLREKYLQYILSNQKEDGGFSSGGSESDVDLTAICLQALSKYRDNEKISSAINKGVLFLSEKQNSQGGYSSFGVENAESAFQVIIALCELGIDIESSLFIKNEFSLIDAILSYSDLNGGFYHIKENKGADLMATEQALCALASLKRANENKSSFYDMSDVSLSSGEETTEKKEYNIPKPGEEKIFTDIHLNKYRPAIKNLSERGIVKGKTETEFFPDDKITRAEFAAIAVRALGLTKTAPVKFKDVEESAWYMNSVAIAVNYKLISGIDEFTFAPYRFITRQEAAAIVTRAAAVLGIENNISENGIRDILSQFEDYLSCDNWASSSLAFCYDKGILNDEEISIFPKAEVTRAEIADMIYNLIKYGE